MIVTNAHEETVNSIVLSVNTIQVETNGYLEKKKQKKLVHQLGERHTPLCMNSTVGDPIPGDNRQKEKRREKHSKHAPVNANDDKDIQNISVKKNSHFCAIADGVLMMNSCDCLSYVAVVSICTALFP